MNGGVTDFHGIDVEGLRKRYAEERELRLNPAKMEQYAEIEGDLSHFGDDASLESALIRDPVDETVEALVIGGGFGGLLMAGNLMKAGIDDLRIIDKASDFGGVWYWIALEAVQKSAPAPRVSSWLSTATT